MDLPKQVLARSKKYRFPTRGKGEEGITGGRACVAVYSLGWKNLIKKYFLTFFRNFLDDGVFPKLGGIMGIDATRECRVELGFEKLERTRRESDFGTIRTHVDKKVSEVFMKGVELTRHHRDSSSGNASGGVSATVSWGGKESPKFEVSAHGSVSDKGGNRATVEVSTNHRGESHATVSADNDKKSEPSSKSK
jgi:hypothetical protein